MCVFCRDVLLIMDRFCSGQQSCSVRVVKLEEFTSPCPDMNSYLQAMYTCLEGKWSYLMIGSDLGKHYLHFLSCLIIVIISYLLYHCVFAVAYGVIYLIVLVLIVTTPRNDCCQKRIMKNIETTKAGYIANSIAETTGCGYNDCPWIIQAAKGQQLNISLYDFGTYSNGKLLLNYM